MAVFASRALSELATGLILAPERYDPRRTLAGHRDDRRLGDLVTISGKTVTARTAPSRCLVIDTGHARDGILTPGRAPIEGAAVGSSKKLARPGQLLISRLRPYLRQVAWLDPWVPWVAPDVTLLCSTEFYVLESSEAGRSIAFLAPYLLAEPVQRVLAAAQEGGHHPRFDANTLRELPVPSELLESRDETSQRVQAACRAHRDAEATLAGLRAEAERTLADGCSRT